MSLRTMETALIFRFSDGALLTPFSEQARLQL